MTKNCILYIPVNIKFFDKWEYYFVDKSINEKLFNNVYICNNLLSFLSIILKKNNINIVYCWWWHRSLLIVLISKLIGIKSLVTGAIHFGVNNRYADYNNKSTLHKIFTQLTLMIADINCFISNHQFNTISQNFFVRNPRLLVSSLGIDNITSKEILLSEVNLKNANKILKISTIIWHKLDQYERKGIFQIVEALGKLKKMGYQFELSIIGEDGGDLDILNKYIIKFDILDEVKLFLNASRSTKNSILINSNIYVQPSFYEGFGNAVLEAMSFGVPVIISTLTAQNELIIDRDLSIDVISADSILDRLTVINSELGSKSYIERCLSNYNLAITKYSFENRLVNYLKILNDRNIL